MADGAQILGLILVFVAAALGALLGSGAIGLPRLRWPETRRSIAARDRAQAYATRLSLQDMHARDWLAADLLNDQEKAALVATHRLEREALERHA